jgi:hypothetical protein
VDFKIKKLWLRLLAKKNKFKRFENEGRGCDCRGNKIISFKNENKKICGLR